MWLKMFEQSGLTTCSAMKVSDMEKELRQEACKLLEEGTVDYIIGFAPGSLKFTTTPLITEDIDEINNLVINPFINNNLAKYLLEISGRVGIIAKGCDSRSIVSLIQDKQIARQDVVILGIPCSGLVDLKKVERLTGKERDEIDDIVVLADKVCIAAGGEKKEFPITDVLFNHCLGCELQIPQEYDFLIQEPAAEIRDNEVSRKQIQELKKMSPDQRWAFWKEQFGRCIRCYACRQVCPACFCERCFVEESQPRWVSPVSQWQDNLIFQAIRTIHVAGRCTDCGECERVCPVNIPLRSLSKEMYDLVGEVFDYKTGMDVNTPALMTAYELVEAEGLIR